MDPAAAHAQKVNAQAHGQMVQRDAENRYAQTTMQNNQLEAQRRASEMQRNLIANPANPRTTNGIESQISNYGGGSASASASGRAGSSGGIAIGGGVYPNISNLMSQFEKQATTSVAAPPRIGAPQVPSTSGAFAHAKDVSGRTGNKAIEALRNSMTQRGISDSGMATMGEANILGNVARQQSDAEYQAANTDNTRQWNANQMAYQGDLGQNEMEYQGAIAQRNQSLQALFNLMQQLY